MARVEFKHVVKVYPGQTHAINDFSLEIEEGEFMVMVGPSGCGKSTLLRILAGLESCTSGEIRLDEQCVNEWSPQQRNVAMVFQNYALYPHMTVRENLEFPLKMRKFSTQEKARRVAESCRLLGLEDLMSRKPAQLSGGQRQRVAMGRALVRDPSVFLLDEPLSNLDARLRVQIRTEIGVLQRRMNITTLYVTHDQVEAMTLGDRVCVLNKGKLQQVATPLELYEKPANIFVAGFLGNPGMNLLTTECIDANKDQLVLKYGDRILTVGIDSTNVNGLSDTDTYILGVRPEALTLTSMQSENDISINMQVRSVESLGHEHLVYGEISGVGEEMNKVVFSTETDNQPSAGLMVVRLPASEQISPGENIALTARHEQIHLFDGQGQRISQRTLN